MTNHAPIRPYDQYFLVAFPRFPVVGRVRQLPLNKIFDQGKLEANFVPEFCHICFLLSWIKLIERLDW